MNAHGIRPTAEEIKLVRAIRHELLEPPESPWPGWVWREPIGTWTHPDGRAFTWDTSGDYDSPQLGVTRSYSRSWAEGAPIRFYAFNWINVQTATEAVDVLVALGFLPVRFSSAYLQGWAVGREDIEHPGPAGEAFRAIVPAALLSAVR